MTTGVYITSYASKNFALLEIQWLIIGTCLRFKANAYKEGTMRFPTPQENKIPISIGIKRFTF